MAALTADLRYALRQLRRAPGFAITAVLTLALGIGATTAVYSVAYGVLIDPFPYHDVKTLATPSICAPDQPRCSWRVYTPTQYLDIARHTDIFTGTAASGPRTVTITGNGAPEQARGNYISANTFTVLGVQPILGRASADVDVAPGHGDVALISYRYWQRHFGGKPTAIGSVLVVEHRARTIIGVMPPRFLWRGSDLYLPLNFRQRYHHTRSRLLRRRWPRAPRRHQRAGRYRASAALQRLPQAGPRRLSVKHASRSAAVSADVRLRTR